MRIETDTEIVGWGEGTSRFPFARWGPARVLDVVNEIIAPTLIGRDPTEPMVIWNELQILGNSPSVRRAQVCRRPEIFIGAISAIDIALWDITGQVKGQPICHLLSKITRTKMKVCVDVNSLGYLSGLFSSDSMLQPAPATVPEAQHYLDLGFDTFLARIHGGLEDNKQRLRASRHAIGRHATIVVENTSGVSAEELARAMPSSEVSLVIEFSRTPLEDNIRALVPVAWGNREWDTTMICDRMARGNVDIVQPNFIICGGFTALLRILNVAVDHGIRVMPSYGSSYGSGIGLAATIQASAATPWNPREEGQEPNPKEPMVILSPDAYSIRNELLVQKIDGSGGYLHVPETPGLGTTVDEQVLNRRMAISRKH